MGLFEPAKRRLATLIVAVFAAVGVLMAAFLISLPRGSDGSVLLEGSYPLRVELLPGRHATHASDAAALTAPDSASGGRDRTPEAQAEAKRFGSSLSAQPSAALHTSDSVGVLAVDFDLSPGAGIESARGSQQIDIAKPLTVNGRGAGTIAVKVGEYSRLYLDRSALVRALEQLDSGLGGRIFDRTQPFVSFDELRATGISVRYDPVTDRISLES